MVDSTQEHRSLIGVPRPRPEESHRLEEEGPQTEAENIFLLIRGDAPTAAPTPRPLTRDFNYRSCEGEFGKSVLAGVASVYFVYDVETTDELEEDEEKVMLNALETAMIDSIFDAACRRRLGGTRRKLEIHSISSGNRDKLQGACAVTSPDATVCSRYDGSIKVGYTEEGGNNRELEAGNTALRVVSNHMVEDLYLEPTNLALGALDGNFTEKMGVSSTMVTRIAYVGTSFYDVNGLVFATSQESSTAVVQQGQMTLLGQILVPVAVALFVGMLVAMYLGYKSHKERRRMARLAVLRAKDDSVFVRKHDIRFVDDVKDLALRASSQDVHRCNNTDCLACIQQIPATLDEVLNTQRKCDDYVQCVEVTDVSDGHSTISGLTGSQFGSVFGRKKQPRGAVIQVNEALDDDDELNTIMDLFQDEPPTVRFVKVDGFHPESERESLGVRRKVIDHSGNVRNEFEV